MRAAPPAPGRDEPAATERAASPAPARREPPISARDAPAVQAPGTRPTPPPATVTTREELPAGFWDDDPPPPDDAAPPDGGAAPDARALEEAASPSSGVPSLQGATGGGRAPLAAPSRTTEAAARLGALTGLSLLEAVFPGRVLRIDRPDAAPGADRSDDASDDPSDGAAGLDLVSDDTLDDDETVPSR